MIFKQKFEKVYSLYFNSIIFIDLHNQSDCFIHSLSVHFRMMIVYFFKKQVSCYPLNYHIDFNLLDRYQTNSQSFVLPILNFVIQQVYFMIFFWNIF